ncbi:MAG: M66 family metalloprotease [Gemmatimonadota bacterium]|nr:M66 family metalloprotease [Gemmatimonadota bacterium]
MKGIPIAIWVAGAVLPVGCADLALEPDQIPHFMEITPADTLITEGDRAKLTLVVTDRDSNPVAGPPSWAPAEWEVSPTPEKIDIAWDGSVTALGGADLRVIARAAGLEAWTTLRVNPADIRLFASRIYLNQVIPAVDGVPVIAGRDAYLRIFATGDETSFYQPSVRATLYQDGAIVHTALMTPGADVLPSTVEEGRLDLSFNSLIPGEIIQPGLGLVVELDTEGIVPLDTGSETRIPAEGVMDLGVVELPTHIQTIVPVLVSSAPDERVFQWTRGLDAEHRHMRFARTVLPIGDMEIRVHEPFYTSSDLTTDGGWRRFLGEIRAVRAMEGAVGYYYGVVVLPPGSRWGGLGFIGRPIGVGRDSDRTFTHELGHNMNLRHAPCGSAGRPDPNYPHDGGAAGVWGYDIHRTRLVDPFDYKDLMGYCNPDWISDYHYKRAYEHRRATEDFGGAPVADRAPAEKTLLLWGSVHEGELLLEPAFLVEGVPTLPESGGAYRLEGYGEGGRTHFSFGFTPDPVEFGGGQFLFAVPYDPGSHGALERIVLSGPEGEFALTPGSTSPMAIITNRASGQVRAIVRDWNGGFTLVDGDTEIMVSDGLPGWSRPGSPMD